MLLPLNGILHGRIYTYRWASLLIWLYAMEGAVRVWSDPPPGRLLAGIELGLALAFFVSSAIFIRQAQEPYRDCSRH